MLQPFITTAMGIIAITAPGQAPFADVDFEQACQSAKDSGRTVLIYVSDTGKPQCESYAEFTWGDESVQQWLRERVVAIEVPIQKAPALCKRFDVQHAPTVLVVSPGGKVRARVVGFRDGETLRSEIETKLRASDPVGLAETWVASNSDSPAALLVYARTLEEAGRIDDALEHYLRCFDGRSTSPGGFGGVQLVVVDELGRLSKTHARAKEALMERRDAGRRRLLTGQGTRTDPSVLASANTWLGAVDDTLEVYEKLQSRHPDSLTTRLLCEGAVDSALHFKRYERIVELIDVAAHAKLAYDQYQGDVQRPIPPGASPATFRALTRSAFVQRTVRYYEMLIGVGRHDQAAQLASMLVSVDDSATTWHLLSSAALRTGHPTAVNMAQARRAVERAGSAKTDMIMTLVEISVLLGDPAETAKLVSQLAPQISDAAQRQRLERLIDSRE